MVWARGGIHTFTVAEHGSWAADARTSQACFTGTAFVAASSTIVGVIHGVDTIAVLSAGRKSGAAGAGARVAGAEILVAVSTACATMIRVAGEVDTRIAAGHLALEGAQAGAGLAACDVRTDVTAATTVIGVARRTHTVAEAGDFTHTGTGERLTSTAFTGFPLTTWAVASATVFEVCSGVDAGVAADDLSSWACTCARLASSGVWTLIVTAAAIVDVRRWGYT